jgi:hypothetical protein
MIKNDNGLLIDESGRVINYLIDFKDNGIFSPEGRVEGITKEQMDIHNDLLDRSFVDGLDKTCEVGQGGIFYYGKDKEGVYRVETFLGKAVSYNIFVNGNNITFLYHSKTFKGKLHKNEDWFQFKRTN